MTKATENIYTDLFSSVDMPIPGEIKIVKGTPLNLHLCNALDDGTAVWSVHSGAGVTIALNTYYVVEGIGSVRVMVPASTTGVVKFTRSSGSWDLSSYKYLNFSIMMWSPPAGTQQVNVHFGESTYNEQNMGAFTCYPMQIFTDLSWNISAIDGASRDAVTIVAFTLPNTTAYVRYFLIDFVYVDPGPARILANDGDKEDINLYPKMYPSSYVGNATHRTISIPRSGVPSLIIIIDDTNNPSTFAIWLKGMGNKALQNDGTLLTDLLHNIQDGSFDLEGGVGVALNTTAISYKFLAGWED